MRAFSGDEAMESAAKAFMSAMCANWPHVSDYRITGNHCPTLCVSEGVQCTVCTLYIQGGGWIWWPSGVNHVVTSTVCICNIQHSLYI